MTGKARVRIVVKYDKENGFDSSASILRSDADRITADYWAAVERAYGKKAPTVQKVDAGGDQ